MVVNISTVVMAKKAEAKEEVFLLKFTLISQMESMIRKMDIRYAPPAYK